MSDITQRDILWTLQEILKALHAIEKQQQEGFRIAREIRAAQAKEREG